MSLSKRDRECANTGHPRGEPCDAAECAVGFLVPGGVVLVAEPPDGDPTRWPADGLASLGLLDEGRVTGAASAAVASSRVKPSSVPVITYCEPVSGPSTGFSSSPISKRSPSSRSSATSFRFCSSENHPAIASALSGPMPSTS